MRKIQKKNKIKYRTSEKANVSRQSRQPNQRTYHIGITCVTRKRATAAIRFSAPRRIIFLLSRYLYSSRVLLKGLSGEMWMWRRTDIGRGHTSSIQIPTIVIIQHSESHARLRCLIDPSCRCGTGRWCASSGSTGDRRTKEEELRTRKKHEQNVKEA